MAYFMNRLGDVVLTELKYRVREVRSSCKTSVAPGPAYTRPAAEPQASLRRGRGRGPRQRETSASDPVGLDGGPHGAGHIPDGAATLFLTMLIPTTSTARTPTAPNASQSSPARSTCRGRKSCNTSARERRHQPGLRPLLPTTASPYRTAHQGQAAERGGPTGLRR